MKKLALSLVLLVSPLSLAAQTAEPENRTSARPIAARDEVWINRMTFMEVRDAIAAGKTTVIIPAGSVEQNGPYSVNGKSHFIMERDAENIARRLGNALVAPVVWFAPGLDPAATAPDAVWPGDIPVQLSTYKAVFKDVATALKMQGFRDIVTIGDNGGNERPLTEVATELNSAWGPSSPARVHHVAEHYAQHTVIDNMLAGWGIKVESEGIHDSYRVEATLAAIDLANVRMEERIAAGKTTINGQTVVPVIDLVANGKKMEEIKMLATVAAIKKLTAARPSTEQR
jgi:creatinine amidohydrolase/Fe(II)-dependent formamide hydrolase-like protein